MPRGKRKTYTEKIQELQEEIHAVELQLKELKVQEKDLLKVKREEELKQIADLLEEKNMTAQELAGILNEVPVQQNAG